jgi:hypothetical protein
MLVCLVRLEGEGSIGTLGKHHTYGICLVKSLIIV